jgi:hypothetical protein
MVAVFRQKRNGRFPSGGLDLGALSAARSFWAASAAPSKHPVRAKASRRDNLRIFIIPLLPENDAAGQTWFEKARFCQNTLVFAHLTG